MNGENNVEQKVELEKKNTKEQFDEILEKIKKMSEAIELHDDVKKAVEKEEVDYNYLRYIENSLEEIDEIFIYISETLKSQNASKLFVKKIISKTEILSRFPKIYSPISKYDKLKREYRKIVIDNYILLYTIDEKEKIVYISHVFYSRKNYLNGLI